jgi:hypothetical protein
MDLLLVTDQFWHDTWPLGLKRSRSVLPAGDSNRLMVSRHILTALIVTDMTALRASSLSI